MKLIPLPPKGKPRPRVTRRGTFMPPAYEQWRKDFARLHGSVEIDDEIALTVIAIRPMPQSWSKSRRERMCGAWCQTTPDADNIAGAVMDAVLDDDSSVVKVEVFKIWGESAGLGVEFKSAESPPTIIYQE